MPLTIVRPYAPVSRVSAWICRNPGASASPAWCPDLAVRYGLVMSLLAFLLFGLLVGLIARALMPGTQSMGCFATVLLGCAGSLVGGLLGNLLIGRSLFALQPSGFIGSVVGALIVLFALRNRFRR